MLHLQCTCIVVYCKTEFDTNCQLVCHISVNLSVIGYIGCQSH